MMAATSGFRWPNTAGLSPTGEEEADDHGLAAVTGVAGPDPGPGPGDPDPDQGGGVIPDPSQDLAVQESQGHGQPRSRLNAKTQSQNPDPSLGQDPNRGQDHDSTRYEIRDYLKVEHETIFEPYKDGYLLSSTIFFFYND